jgi:glycosyltransferase involved in cell wall biosynthesis
MALHRDVAALAELTSVFRRLQPDIVHTHNPKPGVYGRLAARAARVPFVVNTVHGLYALPDDPIAKRAVVYGLERVAACCSDVELIQNPEDLPVLARLGIRAPKTRLLGNGIDLARFDPHRVDPARRKELRTQWNIPDDAIVCGTVGRLVWEKGYRELFEAARALRSSVPELRLVVIGPSDDEKADAVTPADRARAEREAGVVFAGMRDDMPDCYAAFDLFALASHREGFPRAAMEAAAMGLPVVAYDIRGCRQVVDPWRTGALVPRHDTKALTAAIEALAIDPISRLRMAEQGRAKAVREFDQQHQIDITLAAYAELGNLRRPRRAA